MNCLLALLSMMKSSVGVLDAVDMPKGIEIWNYDGMVGITVGSGVLPDRRVIGGMVML